MSSCKKDQETVNLSVAIEQSAKLYIDDHMPSWNAGDQASDGTWVVSTAASTIYAHANCSSMFAGHISDYGSYHTIESHLTSIDFGSGFRTDNVTNMNRMFNNLATTSGACTITCPTAVKTTLESDTNIPTSVTFTWSTH